MSGCSRRSGENIAPSNPSLATVDNEVLERVSQHFGSIVHDYLFLYTNFEEHNTVFTNELFEGVVSLSATRSTIASSTVRGVERRKTVYLLQ